MAKTKQTVRKVTKLPRPSRTVVKNAAIAWSDFYHLKPSDARAVRFQLRVTPYVVHIWRQEYKRMMRAELIKSCLLSRTLPYEIIDKIVQLLDHK